MGEDNDYILPLANAASDALPDKDARERERERVNEKCEEFIKSVADYADGLTATPEETACARKIRDILSPRAVTRLEAFRVSPYAGRNCCGLIGLVYTLAAFFYFVSFGGDRGTGIVLVLVALGIFVAGGIGAGAAFLSVRGKFPTTYSAKICPKRSRKTGRSCSSPPTATPHPVPIFPTLRW